MSSFEVNYLLLLFIATLQICKMASQDDVSSETIVILVVCIYYLGSCRYCLTKMVLQIINWKIFSLINLIDIKYIVFCVPYCATCFGLQNIFF